MKHLKLDSVRFREAALTLISEAMQKGLTPLNPVYMRVVGSTAQAQLYGPERICIVSYTQPPVDPFELQLWCNPLNKSITRSNPSTGKWEIVYVYESLFMDPTQSGGQASSGSSFSGSSLNSLVELRAIDTTTMQDKFIMYVEDERRLYGFDLQGTDADNSNTIIKPTTGPGAWYALNEAGSVAGNIDGGSF